MLNDTIGNVCFESSMTFRESSNEYSIYGNEKWWQRWKIQWSYKLERTSLDFKNNLFSIKQGQLHEGGIFYTPSTPIPSHHSHLSKTHFLYNKQHVTYGIENGIINLKTHNQPI